MIKNKDTQDENESQVTFEAMLREKLQQAVRTALISMLEAEIDAFIGAVRYEHNEQRRDYRNGHYRRSLQTSIGPIDDLPVPRTRAGHQTQMFERYHRRRQDLDEMIGEMFIDGVSQARVGEVVETLTGTKPSASTVSRVFHSLESEYEQWKTRQLAERYVYAEAFGKYFTVIYNHQGCKMPILAVVGISESGEREILAFRVGIERMSRHGRICCKTSKSAGSRKLGCGSVMATRPRWAPSLSSSLALRANAA